MNFITFKHIYIRVAALDYEFSHSRMEYLFQIYIYLRYSIPTLH